MIYQGNPPIPVNEPEHRAGGAFQDKTVPACKRVFRGVKGTSVMILNIRQLADYVTTSYA